MLEITENKITTPKSARKRIAFSSSPKGDSSDSSLGPISPLSESPEQYSSPASSPNWVFETPQKSSLRIRSALFGPVSCVPQTPKSTLSEVFEVLTQASNENQASAANETTVIDTEVIAETPSKCSDDIGFATPFKCLARKSLQQTPKRKCLEAANTESSALTPVKIFPKVKAKVCNSESKASSPLPPMKFYGSRARTSLFPRKCLSAERVDISDFNGAKRKHIYHSAVKLGSSNISRHHGISKRLKVGEINFGVRHGIRKNKFKPHKPKVEVMKQPKITPVQRIESYVNNTLNSTQQHSVPEIDPTKRFFKTKRPLQNDEKDWPHKANPKKRAPNIPSKVQKSTPFDEKSPTEIVQHKVQNDVEVLLRHLEDSPEKQTTCDTQNQHISAITSHTSSLALNDSGPWRQDLLCSKAFKQQNAENIPSLSSHVRMETNVRKYFPVFNKNHGNKGLADTSNIRSPRGTKRPLKCLGEDQYIIDAGQKKFGTTQCNDCGLFYHYDDPEDEIAHQKFHKNYNFLRHSAWKQERVVRYYGTERVILVKAGDPKAWINKVTDVVQIVDQELGYATSGVGNLETCQVYMYVTDKFVVGCLVVNSLTEAYKMLSTLNEECDICSEETYPVKCGVSRIWVAEKFRRRRIATRLIDSMRASFVMGHVLGMQEFAFSAPTAAGKAFAVQYTMTENFLVYT